MRAREEPTRALTKAVPGNRRRKASEARTTGDRARTRFPYDRRMALTCSDILTQTPEGLYCRPGGFHIDPLRPVARAPDHPRPFRPCPRRPRRGGGDVRDARHHGRRATARASPAGRQQALAYGETVASAASPRLTSSLPAMCWARPRSWSSRRLPRRRLRRLQAPARPDLRRLRAVPCDLFITEATFGLPVFRHPDPPPRSASCLRTPSASSPSAAHLVGAYALGKAQRLTALLRPAGYDAPIYLHGAMCASPTCTGPTASTSASCAPRPRSSEPTRRPDRPPPARRAARRSVAPPPRPGEVMACGWMRVSARGGSGASSCRW